MPRAPLHAPGPPGNMLKPALARGQLRCLGATTLDEYRKHIERDGALERRFQPVRVDEPQPEEALSILRGLKERYEIHHGLKINDGALVAAVRLAHERREEARGRNDKKSARPFHCSQLDPKFEHVQLNMFY